MSNNFQPGDRVKIVRDTGHYFELDSIGEVLEIGEPLLVRAKSRIGGNQLQQYVPARGLEAAPLFEVVDEVTVDIADVVPNTERVMACDLRDTDVLFDVFGGELPLKRVRTFKNHVGTTRTDGVYDTWDFDQTLTIKARPRPIDSAACEREGEHQITTRHNRRECDEHVVKGTGSGPHGVELDSRGECPRAGAHL